MIFCIPKDTLRLQEIQALPATKSVYYLFPLTNVNLFPSTTKPLQIFEERYILMVRDSIAQKIPVAICFVPEGTQEIRPIAGFGFPQIVESRADGTLIVFIVGVGKAFLDLQNLKSVDPFIVAHGKNIDQDVTVDDGFRPHYVKLSHVLIRWIKTHVADANQQEIFIRSLIGPQEVVSAFAAYLVTDYDLQYELMQLNSLSEQIQFLYRLLESGELTNEPTDK